MSSFVLSDSPRDFITEIVIILYFRLWMPSLSLNCTFTRTPMVRYRLKKKKSWMVKHGVHVIPMWYACAMWHPCGVHVIPMWYTCDIHVASHAHHLGITCTPHGRSAKKNYFSNQLEKEKKREKKKKKKKKNTLNTWKILNNTLNKNHC